MSNTHTLSALSRASDSPISVMPCDKIYRGADLLPLETVKQIYRDYGIHSVLLARIILDCLGSVWLKSLSSDLSFAPLEILFFFK